MTPYVADPDFTLWHGDALDVLRGLPDGSARACVTSPPYLDTRPEYPSPTPEVFGLIFQELARVCTDCALFNVGRLWRNGIESLWWIDLIHEARRSGWELLDTAVWVKPNANPIHGQVFANRHEYVLVFGRTDSRWNEDGVRVPYAASSIARLRRGWVRHVGVKGDASRRTPRTSEPNELGGRAPSYIVVDTGREKGNPHPAPMPLELAEWMVELASWPGDTIIDPFAGSGTTALAARKHHRNSVAIEQDEIYARLCAARLGQQTLLAEGAA